MKANFHLSDLSHVCSGFQDSGEDELPQIVQLKEGDLSEGEAKELMKQQCK